MVTLAKEWKIEHYTNKKGYIVYTYVLYIDGIKTNRRRKKVYDGCVCVNSKDDIMIKDFLYEFRAFADDEHFIRAIDDYEIGIFHYEEYTEDE